MKFQTYHVSGCYISACASLRRAFDTFKNIHYQRTLLYKFFDTKCGMAFDPEIGLVGKEIWGNYWRVQHLLAHFMNTWEGIMVTKFFHIPNHMFHPSVGPLHTFLCQSKEGKQHHQLQRARSHHITKRNNTQASRKCRVAMVGKRCDSNTITRALLSWGRGECYRKVSRDAEWEWSYTKKCY